MPAQLDQWYVMEVGYLDDRASLGQDRVYPIRVLPGPNPSLLCFPRALASRLVGSSAWLSLIVLCTSLDLGPLCWMWSGLFAGMGSAHYVLEVGA